MRSYRDCLVALFLTALLTTFFTGCGNTGGEGRETVPPAPQTGDTSVFPGATLLSTPADVTSLQTIVLDARHAGYDLGHIPGAISAPPSLFSEEGEGKLLLPVSELEQILGGMGITRTSKIIIYDNTTASVGAGGRLFWMLEYLGCPEVTVLNGGWDQWIAQGMPVETVMPAPRPPAVFTALINDTVFVTKEYIASHLNPNPNFILVDVRTDEEYQGTQLNSTDPRLGHIPGAISFPYSQCFNADKTVLNFNDLKNLLETHGVTVDKEVVAYSTVGKRSGFFYFLCRLMGYPRVVNYSGSIVEWGNAGLIDPVTYPMETGP